MDRVGGVKRNAGVSVTTSLKPAARRSVLVRLFKARPSVQDAGHIDTV